MSTTDNSQQTTVLPPEGVEWFVVRVCPECRQQQQAVTATHVGDCPNLGKMFVALEFPAVTYGDYACRDAEVKTLLDALDRMTTDEKKDPCDYDHHGYCQSHWLEEDCSMAHARELLAALRPEEQNAA